MAIDFETLAASMGYTKKTVEGAGALKGAPCQVQSIIDITGGHRVTFAWEDDEGQTQTDYMDVMDGDDADISANPVVIASDGTLMSISIDGTNYKVNSVKIYDIMPSKADLVAMPNNTYFRTLGFYSKDDNAGGLYLVTTHWGRGTLIIQDANPRKFLVALTENGAFSPNEVPLARYGVRGYTQNTDIEWSNITPQNTYAAANSDIIDAFYGVASYGANYVLPAGRFFFERPIMLNRGGAQVGIRGDGSVWRYANAVLSSYIAGTTLYFPFLSGNTDDNVGILCPTANVENLTVVGNPNTYDFNIDRTKTISAPNEVVTEVIKEVEGTPKRCIGIAKSSTGKIHNVAVMHFYHGVKCETGNIYINNVYSYKCHFGVNIAGDTKCVGIYGWNTHTLINIRAAISSVVSARVDSCVHALQISGGGSINVTDLDGDYCTESLILIGDGTSWISVEHCIFTGIHGRCCTLKSYDSTQSDGVDVRDLQDTTGYGVIRVEARANFLDNIIELNGIGGADPFDSASNYRTPKIVMTMTNEYRYVQRNVFRFVDIQANTPEFFQKIHQAVSGNVRANARFDVYAGTYYLKADGSVILEQEKLIDDTQALANKTYSSEKIEDLLEDRSPSPSYKGKTIVHMGDSWVQSNNIAELAAQKVGYTVIDVGLNATTITNAFLGTPGIANADKLALIKLAQALESNDWTEQDNAVSGVTAWSEQLAKLKAIDWATVDVLILSYGVNDFGYQSTPGDADARDSESVCGALKTAIGILENLNANMEIVVTTPCYRFISADDSFMSDWTTKYLLDDYRNAIGLTAKECGCKLVDMRSISGINESNFTITLASDGLHPTALGQQMWANAFAKSLESGYTGAFDTNVFNLDKDANNLCEDSEKYTKHQKWNASYVSNGVKYLCTRGTQQYRDIVLAQKYFATIPVGSTLKIEGYGKKIGSQSYHRADIYVYNSTKTSRYLEQTSFKINSASDTAFTWSCVTEAEYNDCWVVFVIKNMSAWEDGTALIRDVKCTVTMPSA